MNKIWIIAKREYLTRVSKRSFLLMTLLSPLLILTLYGSIFYYSVSDAKQETEKTILVNDATGVFSNALKNTANLKFITGDVPGENPPYAVLNITRTKESYTYELTSAEQPGLGVVSSLSDCLEEVLKNKLLADRNINPEILQELSRTEAHVKTKVTTAEGTEEGNSGVTSTVGFMAAFLIYMFIFLYGVQVMKGVIEEKTSRIVEVIIASVKPFQLMMGKVLGIAMVGFTQFLIWVVLVAVLSGPVASIAGNLAGNGIEQLASNGEATGAAQMQTPQSNLLSAFFNLNLPLITAMFLFYFAFGYLFYGALFAAVGSAVDSETDTQQFMLPITLPLIFSIVRAQAILNDPNGSVATWLSMIPFTSPVTMMIRLPFGVPTSEIIASMLFLVGGFVLATFFAGRIYRIGILTYGKKPSYREVFRWLFQKN